MQHNIVNARLADQVPETFTVQHVELMLQTLCREPPQEEDNNDSSHRLLQEERAHMSSCLWRICLSALRTHRDKAQGKALEHQRRVQLIAAIDRTCR